MSKLPPPPRACAHPNCEKPGLVQVKGNAAWFCFEHKPHGRMK